MLQNLGIVSILLLASQLLVIVQQCAGSIDNAVCKNNKGTINIRNDDGSCKCSVTVPTNDRYAYVDGGSAYRYYSEPKTWNQARKICENDGAHLPIIDSDFERRVLIDLIELYGKTINGETDSKRHFWLGIHDQHQEGEWSNVMGEPLGYAPWSTNCFDTPEPDNTNEQDCGTLVRNCGYMDDVQCGWKLAFFCEKPHTCT